MEHMNANRFRHLMRRHHWTIKTLAIGAGVTQGRIRELRESGIHSGDRFNPSARIAALNVWGWTRIITRMDVMGQKVSA